MATNPRDLLIRPVITEKTSVMMQDNKYTFKVPLTANKTEIRQAVEKIFNVKVEKVNTVRVLGKTKRMGRYVGKRSDYKKALIITNGENENVELSSRNMPKVTALSNGCLNCFDLLNNNKVFLAKDAIARIEEVLA